jgi:hypothetical protein
VHIASLATDEGLVNFDFTAQLATEGFILQGQTNPMQHEPSSLLSNLHVAGKFATADAILAVREQPQSGEPLIQTDSGILAYTTNLNGKFTLRMVARTSPSAAMLPEFYFEGTFGGTDGGRSYHGNEVSGERGTGRPDGTW